MSYKDPVEQAAYLKQWAKDHPEKIREYHKRYHSGEAGQTADFSRRARKGDGTVGPRALRKRTKITGMLESGMAAEDISLILNVPVIDVRNIAIDLEP